MWLQQRLKGLPGLLSSSWARRLLALLSFLLVAYWYLGGIRLRFLPWGSGQPRGGAAGLCLQAETGAWLALAERGEALLLLPGDGGDQAAAASRPAVVGNGFLLLDVASNRLWVSGASSPAYATEYPALVQLRAVSAQAEARASAALLREGMVKRARCIQTGQGVSEEAARDCVTVREELLAHRSRPHLYLQRVQISNPTERLIAFEATGPTSSLGAGKFATVLEKAEERQFLLSSGRVLLPDSPKVLPVVVAAKKLVNRVQVAPKTQFDETLLSVVHISEPVEPSRLEETFSKLREAAKKEMMEVMRMGVEDLFQEHQQAWSDLFISGVEMREITDAHTPSSETVNMTLYYVLSSTPAPLLDPLIKGEEREKMEASLNYADHCSRGHATMHAETLWPAMLLSVPQILQLSDLWKLTLQKRGCKALVMAGAHGLMQGMVLSFGGLQFTENHLQFQADPDVLHNSYSLRGIHYNKDLINLAVLLDAERKPFLHVSVKFQDKPVMLYACEAGCLNEPVELTSELRGQTFPVLVTQPITPLLYISTDLVHLQDLRRTLHLKAILPHHEHMAKQYPGLPFLFWFSVASLITLFHLFLFKLIYNEYCGPGAKPLFRSKEDPSV
uniref:KIAA2013 n=1 Tax=Sphenodon punctatus TaxID=8508 RepID=A0A8D0GZG2_SPHPU